MKKRSSIAALFISSILIFSACKKNDDIRNPSAPQIDANTVTPAGTPVGNPSKKVIDALGGEITSADGVVTVIIPAGAVSAAKEFSIQQVSKQLPSAVGDAYRLTPHGEQFNVPVKIIFKYKDQDLTNTLPEFLDVAFQDTKGSWQAMTNTVVDKPNKKLTVTTTHFSDWTYFKSIQLTPQEATVELGDVLWLKVTTTFPFVDPDDAPPGTTTIPVYTNPRPLRPDEIIGWTYTGAGQLAPETSKALYTAPNQEPTVNPEAVAVKINMHRKGQFMLIANITVLSNRGVDYLQVDEDYLKLNHGDKCALYMYGNFATAAAATIRSVKIDGVVVEADLWAPNFIRCWIDREISGAINISANGETVANSNLRKWKSNFVYTRYHGGVLNSGNADALKEETIFTIVYRGFGKPCPANVNPLFQFDAGLAKGTEADFTLSGTAAVTTPGPCPTTSSISIPRSTGLTPVNPLSVIALTGFKVHVKDKDGGIEIKVDFDINNVTPALSVQRTNCNGTSFDQPRTYGVGFEGFHNTPINLAFWGTNELTLKGTDVLRSPRMSTGILIEAWDGTGNPSHYETDGLMQATFKNHL